jgi:DNA-binding CsgD family transcriptional regulator
MHASSDMLFVSSARDSEIERVLCVPSPEFAAIANADNSDVILYTTNLDRQLMYMSKSSWNVCRLNFENWKKRSFVPMFTENPINDFYKSFDDRTLVPNQIQILQCEIFSDEGNPVQLEVRRTLVMYKDEPVGVIGLTRRIRKDPPQLLDTRGVHWRFDFSLVESLTSSERYVVESVVQGELNKNIAKRCNVTERTIESRRARAMSKLGVKSLPDLVRYWVDYSAYRERERLPG